MKTVEQVMVTGVPTVSVGKTVSDAIALMLEHDVSLLPVINGDRLVGLITMRDLLRALPYRPVVDVMQKGLVTASRSMPITGVYALMEELQIGQLPVVEQGQIVGLITREAILRELGLPIDPLTELPWSAALRERAVRYLKEGHEIAVIFLDLDNFGAVNKRHGHVIGDRYIKAVADALLATLDPAKELLCRYAGDEFAILTTRRREEAEELSRAAVETIEAVRPEGAPDDFMLSASTGIAGGKRTTEREDVHFEATVDDLITIASKQTTQVKLAKTSSLAVETASDRPAIEVAVRPTEPRLLLRRINLSTVGGEVTATVELGLGSEQYVGEVKGPGLGMAPWRLLAYATAQAVNHVLPDAWRAAVDEVHILSTWAGSLVTVTLYLGHVEGPQERCAGCVLVEGDTGPAVVKATLQAINRRLARLLP
ncbi:MAG: CBS domain-containing protein [bacterium]